MCTRTILLVLPSVSVVIVAVFMTLEPFQEYRQQLWNILSKAQDQSRSDDIVITKEELAKYTGKNIEKGIYLAILGRVYDVSSGSRHYGPGGGYSFFAGKDATRAYVSGDFSEKGLVEDISGLSPKEMLEIEEWLAFFEKKYKYIAKLEGLFYNSNGHVTANLQAAHDLIERGHKVKAQEDDDARIFPPCNTAWTKETGSQVWCTNKSGGIARDWVGVPRQYFQPGSPVPRCACVRNTGSTTGGTVSSVGRGDLDNPHLKEYEDCHPSAVLCQLR